MLKRKKKVTDRIALGVRLLLVVVFVGYGGIKLLGGQYYYGDWTMSKSSADGTSLVWAFYGYSPFYGRLTGLFELLPALMLLSRRTSLLGALGLFAVGLNVTLMDFAFRFPSVKYMILGYTLLAAWLVYHERDRLLLLLRTPAQSAAQSACAASVSAASSGVITTSHGNG